MIIIKDNSSLSNMSGHGESVSSELIDKQDTPSKHKRNNTSDTLIKGKEIIQETDKPSKRANEDSIPDVEKIIQKKHLGHLKIRKTALVILIRRRVVPMILQVQLMVV